MEATIDRIDQMNEEISQQLSAPQRVGAEQGRAVQQDDAPALMHYALSNKLYYIQDEEGYWIAQTLGDAKRYLSLEVYNKLRKADRPEQRIEQHILLCQRRHNVFHAGPIAGYDQGLYNMGGNRVLVTRGPKLIKARKGDWSNLKWFMESLLEDQVGYMHAWVKCAVATLAKGPRFRRGQAVILTGKSGCGKSVWQDILTELFGGRAADPFKFLSGETSFNGDLIENEHLAIEDKGSSTDTRTRRKFGVELKSLVANNSQRGEDKFMKALRATPFNRLTFSLNDEPENLMVLPPLDESLQDKISIYKCHRVPFQFRKDDEDAFDAWREQITGELPAYLAYLKAWKIPADLQDLRYGCTEWRHPEIVALLEDLQPELMLIQIIDAVQPWSDYSNKFTGTAAQLHENLLEKDKSGRIAKLLWYTTACGVLLAKLAKKMPDRVTHAKRKQGHVIWTVNPAKAVKTED